MAGDVVNMKVNNPLKQRNGLTGNCHAICHYLYNLPLCFILTNHYPMINSLDYRAIIYVVNQMSCGHLREIPALAQTKCLN
jgi:hypothetical protein